MARKIWLDFQDGNGFIDISDSIKYNSLTITPKAFSNNYHYAQNEATFDIIYTDLLFPKLRLSTRDILCKIYEETTPLFSGRIPPTKSRKYNGKLNNTIFKVEAVDDLLLLNKESGDFCYRNYQIMNPAVKTQSIVHQLAYLCGFTDAQIDQTITISYVVEAFTPPNPTDKVLDLLDALLFEYGYTLNIDASGLIAPLSWIQSGSPVFSFDKTNIIDSINVKDALAQYDGAEVIYNELGEVTTVSGNNEILVYRDNNLPYDNDGSFAGYPVAPSTYYPPATNTIDETTSTNQKVYQEYDDSATKYWTNDAIVNKRDYNYKAFQSDFSGIVATSGWRHDFSADAGIVADITQFENRRAEIRFHNPTGGWLNIYYNNVYANILYKSKERKTQVVVADDDNRIDTYVSNFVFTKTDADRLAVALGTQRAYGNVQYTFSSEAAVDVGTYVEVLLEDGTNQTATVMSQKWDEAKEYYTYTLSSYSEDSGTITSQIVSESPLPGLPEGIPGTTGYRTATMTLYKWLSDPPTSDWPTGFSTYTWATGEWTLPATPNSWTKTPGAPAQGQLLYAINLIVTNNNTDAESTVYWLASPTVNVVGAAGIDGDPGDDGKTTELRYAKNTSATTGPSFTANNDNPGASWSATAPSLATNEYLWRIESMWLGTERLTNWTGLVRMSGIQGPPGADSEVPGPEGPQGVTGPGAFTPNLSSGMTQDDATTFRKSGGTDTVWDGQLYSTEGLIKCILEFRSGVPNKIFMMGLNSDPSLNANYTSIDFCWYAAGDSAANIYEGGTSRGWFGTYTASTIFSIIWDGTNILYYKDGVLAYTSTVPPAAGTLLYLDSSFYHLTAKATSVKFGSLTIGMAILAGTVGAKQIAAGAITADRIAANSLTALQMSALSIFSKAYEMSSNGALYVGNPSYALAQLFLGRDGGAWKFRLGDKLKYDGVTLEAPGIFTEKIKVPSGGSIRYETGIGVQKRAVQLADEKIDWIDTPDTSPASPEVLRARIGRLGASSSILFDGEFNAQLSAPWGDVSTVNAANCLAPSLIQQSDGTLRVVYLRYSDRYLLQRTSADGTSWSSESTINGASTGASDLIQQSNGTLRVVYLRTSDWHLVQRTSANGTSWSSESVINAASSGSPRLIQQSDGTFRVIYRRASDGHLVQRTSANGTSWSSESVINAANIGSATLIQQFDGTLRVVYTRASDGHLVQRTSANGTSWSSESVINTANTGSPNLIQHIDGTLRVAYRLVATDYIMQRTSADGTSWSSESVVNNAISSDPRMIQQANGELRVVYWRAIDGFLLQRTLQRYAQIGAGIIETGHNTDGSYIKFSDGTMQCWQLTPVLALGTRAVTFPMPFIDAPIVIGNPNSTSTSSGNIQFRMFPYNATTTQFSIYGGGGSVQYVAIGRWK